MNRIKVNVMDIDPPVQAKTAVEFCRKVLEFLNLENWELSLLFCSPEVIRSLNRQYRSLDEETDVLSFPIGEKAGKGKNARFIAGDIVVSLKNLQENSKYFKVSDEEELRRILVHGILHLAGEDHEGTSPQEPMLRHQEEILAHLAGSAG